jgi:flavin-binding protein dodecin
MSRYAAKEEHVERSSFVSVAKVIEITSTSPGSFEDAIRKGLAKAQKTVDNVRGAWISEHKVELADDGTIKHFRVDMKLTFVLED